MDKELEKELEEVVREALRPENRQKLLLGILFGMNMASAMTSHHGRKLEAIQGKAVGFGDHVFNDYVKEMIERNKAKLRSVEQIVNVSYSFLNKKSPG